MAQDNFSHRGYSEEQEQQIRVLHAMSQSNLTAFWNNPSGHPELIIKFLRQIAEASSDLKKL